MRCILVETCCARHTLVVAVCAWPPASELMPDHNPEKCVSFSLSGGVHAGGWCWWWPWTLRGQTGYTRAWCPRWILPRFTSSCPTSHRSHHEEASCLTANAGIPGAAVPGQWRDGGPATAQLPGSRLWPAADCPALTRTVLGKEGT